MQSLTSKNMQSDIWYLVTKKSKYGEFQVGDSIRLEADGCISNKSAAGWMEKEDVPAATEGMEIKLDLGWVEKQKNKAEKIIENMKNISAKIIDQDTLFVGPNAHLLNDAQESFIGTKQGE